jgi:hypothetical protein
VIFPGMAVSAAQFGLDTLLLGGRYSRVVTHDAILYGTTQEYVLWQHAQLLSSLAQREELRYSLLGISLGGSTALQLLMYLQREAPPLHRCARKLLTLATPVLEEDLTQRWQRIVRLGRSLYRPDQPRSVRNQLVRSTVLRALALGVRSQVRESPMEADTSTEIVDGFIYWLDILDTGGRELRPGGLTEVRIVSVEIPGDAMVRNAQAHRFGDADCQHVSLSAQVSERGHFALFDPHAREELHRLVRQELD